MKATLLAAICYLTAFACDAQTDDPFPELRLFNNYCAPFALDETPGIPADTNLIAIWQMKEDNDPHNYFVMERYKPNLFVFTYMNRGGSNRTYENVSCFFSKIENTYFLNVWNSDRETGRPQLFFLKVTDLDSRGWDMTLSLVTDPTLKDITSREALRDRLKKNLNNAEYFSKPVHLHKKLPLMFCK